MSRWWRAYDEAVDDPKLQQLPAELFRAWFNICCITSQNGGTLPDISAIAFKLRCKPAKAEQIINSLIAARLIDVTADGNAPHNWKARQFKSDNADSTNAERQARYREKQRNDRSNAVTTVTVTDPETEQRQSITEKKRTRAKPRGEDLDFEKWYRVYPRREARGAAEKAYRIARKSADAATLLAGAERASAKAAGADPKFIPLPATWLNQKRWLDEAPNTPQSVINPVTPDEAAVKFFKQVGRWHRDYGPEPGQIGCRVAPEILEAHGFAIPHETQTEAA